MRVFGFPQWLPIASARPKSGDVEELLIDLEDDKDARAVVVGADL